MFSITKERFCKKEKKSARDKRYIAEQVAVVKEVQKEDEK